MKNKLKQILRFWEPESGIIGGCIFGSIIGMVIVLFFNIIIELF